MNFLKSMPKEKLQKVALVAILSLISVGAVGNFYIRSHLTKLSAERDRVAKLRTQLDLAQSSVKTEAKNNEVRDQLHAFILAQREKTISGDPFSWIVREISLLAEKHPIRVVSLRPGTKLPNTIKSKYDMFATRLELEGTYDQLGAFIRELENNFATGQIRALEVTASDPTHAQCRAALELGLLVQSDDIAKTAAKPSTEAKKDL